eukprot:1681953-Amphidinium_carterae.1
MPDLLLDTLRALQRNLITNLNFLLLPEWQDADSVQPLSIGNSVACMQCEAPEKSRRVASEVKDLRQAGFGRGRLHDEMASCIFRSHGSSASVENISQFLVTSGFFCT